MLGLLGLGVTIGLVLMVASGRKTIRWLGAGLCALSLPALIGMTVVLRLSSRPPPLPEVRGPQTHTVT
ncbi:hypothetical protein KUL25_18815 [Rhodobacteraceae bacterium N5(2021)]|uniref:Uncharacterized protein n=1 Tax=Gymnodinialimonas phycosphaerae TaxID=2841589 RepID=A0A975YFI3_9RHOB|nr:hypothetical protein [Gymnodinialimonas phycosphaerae]MBY4894814.1 hypothetical protein [Gymnodinialimonas phycosphaerae]